MTGVLHRSQEVPSGVTAVDASVQRPQLPTTSSQTRPQQLPTPTPSPPNLARTLSDRPGPEPGSINALMRAHPRIRLYVPSIAWLSSHQLRLLGCHFVRRPIVAAPGEQSNHRQHNLSWQKQVELIRAARYLRKPSIHTSNTAVVRGLLQIYDYATIPYENLPLRFGGRIVDKVWVDSLFSSDPRTAHPTFAHIHYETLQRHRRRHVNSSRKRRFNLPIEQLERAKLRRLQPLQEEEDPYIIAILIAMAQEQQCLSSPAPICDPSSHGQHRVQTFFKVNLIASQDTDSPCLWIYKASIPSTFLDRLDEPSRFFPDSDFMVRYCRIPFSVSEKFADRLHRVLSSTVVGAGPASPVHCDAQGSV